MVSQTVARPVCGAKKRAADFAPGPSSVRFVRSSSAARCRGARWSDAGGDVHIGHGLSVCESLEDSRASCSAVGGELCAWRSARCLPVEVPHSSSIGPSHAFSYERISQTFCCRALRECLRVQWAELYHALRVGAASASAQSPSASSHRRGVDRRLLRVHALPTRSMWRFKSPCISRQLRSFLPGGFVSLGTQLEPRALSRAP